jgi:4-aminobutyrate aminotransferase/(S)-3-amino-2-methylpropionate transaminase
MMAKKKSSSKKTAKATKKRTAVPTGPVIKVTPPGPKARIAIERKNKFVTTGMSLKLPTNLAKGEGSFLFDTDGNSYIDFSAGIGVHNFGHRPPQVVKALKAQADKLWHICYMVSLYDPYTDLCEAMWEISPKKQLTKSIWLNSGSEANENALKIARAYTKQKRWIASFKTSFHGRTILDISLTAKEKPYRDGFGPLIPDVVHLDYAYCYRCHLGMEFPNCNLACVDKIRETLESPPYQGNVCSLFIEPIQGEGGFIVPPPGYFQKLYKVCKDNGIVFIDDEVQAGMDRSGKIWAIEHWDVVPDILVSGKGIAAGMPLAGVTGREEIMSSPYPGQLGGTYGGNPLACAAALECIKLAKKHLPRTKDIEAVLRKRLNDWKGEFEAVGDVRGKGAMYGFELVKNKRSKEPNPDLTNKIQKYCFEHGLYILTAGTVNQVIRFLPPITTPMPVLEKGLDIVEAALCEYAK